MQMLDWRNKQNKEHSLSCTSVSFRAQFLFLKKYISNTNYTSHGQAIFFPSSLSPLESLLLCHPDHAVTSVFLPFFLQPQSTVSVEELTLNEQQGDLNLHGFLYPWEQAGLCCESGSSLDTFFFNQTIWQPQFSGNNCATYSICTYQITSCLHNLSQPHLFPYLINEYKGFTLRLECGQHEAWRAMGKKEREVSLLISAEESLDSESPVFPILCLQGHSEPIVGALPCLHPGCWNSEKAQLPQGTSEQALLEQS